MQIYPESTQTYPIPFKHNKPQYTLTAKEVQLVEEFYNHSLSNPTKEDLEFWSNIDIDVPAIHSTLDRSNPADLLKIGVLTNMGILANNMEEVMENPDIRYIFVIEDKAIEIEKKQTYYERKAELAAQLQALKAKSTTKQYLIDMAYFISPNRGEPRTKSEAFVVLMELIEGESTDTKKEGLNRFEDVVKKDKAWLKVNNIVGQAIEKNIIRRNSKMYFYNTSSNQEYGKRREDVISFLLEPANQAELGGYKDAPEFSIVNQLKAYRYV